MKIPHNKKTTEQFVNEAKSKWNYDFSITQYTNKETKIKYICQQHGTIEQKPYLLIKNGCPFCSGRGINKYTTEEFVRKAKEIHDDYYDYSKTVINGINNKIIIICPEHGEFKQKAANHIHLKNGCPECMGGVKITKQTYIKRAKVKAEKEIANLISSYYDGNILYNNRSILEKHKEIDIFLPELKLGIEYNGNYWHIEGIVGKKYHLNKTKLAENKGIKLIQIFEYEWQNKKEIVISRIKSLLGVNKKIYARNTKIINLDVKQKNNFLEKTHIQGKDNSSIYYGLEYEDNIVAIMTFGKPRYNSDYNYELIRYSSETNTNVIGGAGKLLNHFRKAYVGSIISYADRRWSLGDMYKKLGFEFNGYTSPGYVYYHINNKNILGRIASRKLTKNQELSEYDLMKTLGYDRIWGVGNSKWILM